MDNDTGHGRINFWKACLAAENDGLPIERHARGGRTEETVGTRTVDAFFKTLDLKDHTVTRWYGFDVRVRERNAAIWFTTAAGGLVAIADAGQARLNLAGVAAGEVVCYLSTQSFQSATGRPLPSMPFTTAELGASQRFMGRFSMRDDQLAGMTRLQVWRAGVNPAMPGDATPVIDIPVGSMLQLRQAQGSADPAIRRFVRAFDDYVFHIED